MNILKIHLLNLDYLLQLRKIEFLFTFILSKTTL